MILNKIKMKLIGLHKAMIKVSLFAIAGTLLTSCANDYNSPGYEFAPDMYRSKSFDYYAENVIGTGATQDTIQTNRLPVSGTIARGFIPPIAPNMTYEDAGLRLKNPIALSPEVEKEAQDLYGKYCTHCHGDAGAGDGKVGGKLPGAPPSYSGPLKNLPEGKIFYSIYKGKGLMGAHGNMLSTSEIWKLVHYVQKLQGPKEAAAPAADSAAVNLPAPPTEPVKEEKK